MKSLTSLIWNPLPRYWSLPVVYIWSTLSDPFICST